MRLRLFFALVFAAALAGCDRPFVPLDPPRIEVLRPGLDTVRTDARLILALRVTALRTIARVEVNGEAATHVPDLDAFLDTLDLELGLNTLRVEATDREGNAGTDTLFAVYLPLQTGELAAFALPEARADHTATLLDDGRVLVTGGTGRDGTALGSSVFVGESGLELLVAPSHAVLAKPRLGHTASRLPDGRVLIVGGATTPTPTSAASFATTGELYDPSADAFTTLPFAGAPVERAFHTAHVLTDQNRTFVYLYGGRGPLGTAEVGTRSDVTVLEVRSTAGVDSLVNLSPGGGVGAFPPAANHVQLPLPPQGGYVRSLVAGTYAEPGGGTAAPVAFRFLQTPSAFFFPFETLEESLPPMRENRIAHAGAPFSPGLALLAGGRTPGGTVVRSMEVFADGAGRFFAGPASRHLRTPRQRHTATLLPSGRILLLGGTNAQGTVLASAEIIFPDAP